MEECNRDYNYIVSISEFYRVADWVAINKMVSLDPKHWFGADKWNERFGLDAPIQRAIAREVENLARAITKEKEEQRQKLETQLQSTRGTSLFPSNPPSTIQKFFN